MKIKQTIALGLAGCLIFGSTVMAAPVDNTKEAPAAETVITEKASLNEVQITSEKMEVKNEYMEINIAYPVISGLTDADFQKHLNEFVEKHVIKAKEDIEAQVQEYVQLCKENNWEIRPYQLFVEYEVKANTDEVLSFTMTYYTYTGGANGMTVVHCYNIDKKANTAISLKDLFPAGADYTELINKEIVKQIELRSKDGEEMFFEGDMGFKSISDTQGFYFKDNDIVIVFPKYEIAPGAMGIPEFVLNLADLEDNLTVKDDSKISINGVEITTVLNDDKIVMIPLRMTAEQLGYNLEWNAEEQSVLLTKGQATAKLKIGDNIYIANHKIPYELEAVPVIIDGSTYVPVTFLETVLLYKL